MEFRRKKRRSPILNITPLIDVLFLLLIFFMVSSRFAEEPNIKLELPRTAHADVSAVDLLTVTVTKRGELFFGERPIAKRDLPDLLLVEIMKKRDRSLVVKADKNVPHGWVVELLDIAKGVGFERIVLPTSLEELTDDEKKE